MVSPYSTEFNYLFDLIQHRLNKSINETYKMAGPAMPPVGKWNKNLSSFINQNNVDKNASVLLLIALAPYVYPHLFDDASAGILGDHNFPKIGGTKGKNFRGFLPTGETAFFIISGDNPQKRSDVQSLFQADHLFADKKVLWLETLPEGEPSLHGRLIMSQDYIEMLTNGKHATPHFSMSFPARRITTKLTWKDLVISNDLKEQIGELENWLSFNDQLVNDWGMGDRLKKVTVPYFMVPPAQVKHLQQVCWAIRLTKKFIRLIYRWWFQNTLVRRKKIWNCFLQGQKIKAGFYFLTKLMPYLVKEPM